MRMSLQTVLVSRSISLRKHHWGRAIPVHLFKQLSFALAHASRIVLVVVVVAQHVQDSVRHQESDFIIKRSSMPCGLVACDTRTYHYISNQ